MRSADNSATFISKILETLGISNTRNSEGLYRDNFTFSLPLGSPKAGCRMKRTYVMANVIQKGQFIRYRSTENIPEKLSN